MVKENYICSGRGRGDRGPREMCGIVVERVWLKRITYAQSRERGGRGPREMSGVVVERVGLKRITECSEQGEGGPWAAGNVRDSSVTGVAKENYICSE